MAILIGQGRQQLTTSTLQTFTAGTLGSNVPTFALLRLTAATENGFTASASAQYCRAATDGSTDAFVRMYYEDADAGAATGSIAGGFGAPAAGWGLLRMLSPTGGTGPVAKFDSWVAGGIRLDFTTLPTATTDYFLEYILFVGGGDLTTSFHDVNLAGLAGTQQDFTTLGKPADLVLFWAANFGAFPAASNTRAEFYDGAWARAPHSTSGGTSLLAAFGSGDDPAKSKRIAYEDLIAARIDVDQTIDSRVRCITHASGFSFEAIDDQNSGVDGVAIAFNFNGTKFAFTDYIDTPTTTGVVQITSPRMTPDLVFLDGSRLQTLNTDPGQSTDGSVISGGAFIPGTGGFCSAASSEHAADPSVAKSVSINRALAIPNPDGGNGSGYIEAVGGAALPGMGYELNFTMVDSVARKVRQVVIGDSFSVLPSPVTIPLQEGNIALAQAQIPTPVLIPIGLPLIGVGGPLTLTPTPASITITTSTPFTGFLLPTPVLIPVVAPDPVVIAPPIVPPPPDKAEAYRSAMFDLLPQGVVWHRDPDTEIGRVLFALAREYARTEDRALEVLEEADTRTASELLAEWEDWLGIAFDAAGLADSIQERRAAIWSKWTSPGGQTPFHYSEYAKQLGFDVEVEDIEEFQEYVSGEAAMGDALTNGDWVFAWTVHAPTETPRFFRSGTSAVGEPLVTFGNELLIAAFQAVAPAHTLVLFAFDKTYTGYAPWEVHEPTPVAVLVTSLTPLRS